MSDIRLSDDAFRKYMESVTPVPKVVRIGGMQFLVKPIISLEEMLTFVSVVTDMCFAKDGTYMPELYDFAIRCGLYQVYADFELPSDPSEKYAFVYNAPITEEILATVDNTQFKAIVRAIDKKIAQRAAADVSAVTMRMNELDTALSNVVEKISSTFDGLDAVSLQKLASAVEDGKFNITDILAAVARKQ